MTITPAQAFQLLTAASTYDRRDVTKPEANAWALALTHNGVQMDDAMDAVVMHYAVNDDWLTPAKVTAIARDLVGEREHHAWKDERDKRLGLGRYAAEVEAALPPRPPLRDRKGDLHKLIEGFRVGPDGSEKWPRSGDPGMRLRQSFSPNPLARAAAEEASRAKARAQVAESRMMQGLPARNAEEQRLYVELDRAGRGMPHAPAERPAPGPAA